MTTVYTIGHSTKSAEELLERLRTYKIDRLIDIRTRPYSRWCPQFNRGQLAYYLAQNDFNYDWRGSNLGGKSENIDYHKTIQEVARLAETENVVLMCSEQSHLKCHRYTMLTPDLEQLGLIVEHITYEIGRECARVVKPY